MIEKIYTWIAWHLPKTLVMWCYIRLAANATCTKYRDKSPNEIGLLDALDCWK